MAIQFHNPEVEVIRAILCAVIHAQMQVAPAHATPPRRSMLMHVDAEARWAGHSAITPLLKLSVERWINRGVLRGRHVDAGCPAEHRR